MADIIQFNQEEIKSQLGDLVKQTVEDTLNAMLDAEADQITQAHKLKKNWGGTIENIAILVALGVNSAGNLEIIGAAEGGKEDKESWLKFLRSLKERGLSGVRLMVGDKCLGLIEAIREVFPDTDYQRCIVHFMRNVFTEVPRTRGKEIGAKLKAIFAQEDRAACLKKAEEVARFLRENRVICTHDG